MTLIEKIGLVLLVVLSTVVAIGAMWWMWTFLFWLMEKMK
jgi:hypothetical protein